jgi:hypothetical protein
MRLRLRRFIDVERGLRPARRRARIGREDQLKRRLERGRRFIERFAPDVAIGPHHRRRDVAHLRLDDPVRLSLLGQARQCRVASVVEAYVIEAGGLP